MSRVSETMDLIDTINKTAESIMPFKLKSDAVIGSLLADIAKSLAVIADEIKEQEHEN